MLGAPLALASKFPSAIHPRDVHKVHKKVKGYNDLISRIASTSTTKHKDQKRRIDEEEPCGDASSDELWEVIGDVQNEYYDGIECSADETECKWDLSEPVANGSFDFAAGICQSGGGTLYTMNAEIDCDDGTRYTLLSSPLGCLSTCSVEMVEMFSSMIPAGPYVGKEEDSDCSWVSFEADSIEADIDFDDVTGGEDDNFGDDVTGGEDDYFGDDYYSNTCAGVETDAYNNALFPIILQYGVTPVCDESNPPTCKYDFSLAVESGAMDAVLAPCNADGGELYLASWETTCGEDGLTQYDLFPLCLKSCDESLFVFFFPEGGDADGEEGNCTFTGVSDVSVYGEDASGDDAVEEGDDHEDEEDNDSVDGTCEPVESEAYSLVMLMLTLSSVDSITCDETDTNCTIDFTSALGGDEMDGVAVACAAEGGEVFISTFTTDCGEDGITSLINYPVCMTSCSVDFLLEFMFIEGGPASDEGDCTFTEVGDVYPLAIDNEDDGFIGDDATDGDDGVTEDDATDGDDMAPKSPKSPKSPKMAKGTKSVKKTAKKTKAPKAMQMKKVD